MVRPRAWIQRLNVFIENPLLLILLWELLQCWRRWGLRLQKLSLPKRLGSNFFDPSMISAALFSTESMLSLGRVEMRSLFKRDVTELLSGDAQLSQRLQALASKMSTEGGGCVLSRMS